MWEWTGDRKRCREAGVPKRTPFRTRHELALEVLAEHGATLPPGGSAATTRWADRRHFARNYARRASDTCCPFRPTR